MNRYIDADKLIEFANNTKDKTIDVNDIARFPSSDVRENIKSEWELTDHAYTVYCKECGYKHNRASQYCPECGVYMTNGTKWFVEKGTV